MILSLINNSLSGSLMQRVWFNKTFSSITSALQLIRTADKSGDYHLICSNTKSHALPALVAHEYHQEPSGLTGEAYVDWCLDFCRAQQVGIFVPGKAAALVSAARERFAAEGTRVLAVADSEVLHLLHDKARFYQEVVLPMAPPAQFCVVNSIEQFDTAWETLRPQHAKLCIKPSSSVYGLGFAIIDEERDSAQLLLAGAQYQVGLQDLRRGLQQMGEFRTMLLMQYLPGHEYSVDCVGDRGHLICAVARKKSLKAGHPQTIAEHPTIHAACAMLCQSYQLSGNFNAQFREDEHGNIHLLEINPRMSGGIAMACVAGPNLPYLALAGFDKGFAELAIPPVQSGIFVAEWSQAVELA